MIKTIHDARSPAQTARGVTEPCRPDNESRISDFVNGLLGFSDTGRSARPA
jgi:hypothetical protein